MVRSRQSQSRVSASGEYECQEDDRIGRILESKGNHQFRVELSSPSASVEAKLPNRFKKTVWIRRGSFVVLRGPSESPSIEHILSRDEIKALKRADAWPSQFIERGKLGGTGEATGSDGPTSGSDQGDEHSAEESECEDEGD